MIENAREGKYNESSSEDEENFNKNNLKRVKQEYNKDKTPYQIEMENKREFKKALDWDKESSDQDSDDDFLVKKNKSAMGGRARRKRLQ